MATTVPGSRSQYSGVWSPPAPHASHSLQDGSFPPQSFIPSTHTLHLDPSQERLQLNKLGPSWESMFRTDLAETYGPSCHDELEVGEDSLLHVLQVFLAFPGSTERRVLGH